MASSEGIAYRWEAFNRWCDEYADRHQGMKPKVEDVRRWHRENAEKVWPDSSERPSVFLAVSHNKGRRVRGHKTCEYYKRYRAGKAAEQQLAARLQPAALSGRRILAVTAAARRLNTDGSRGASKRSFQDDDPEADMHDLEGLERSEKRRRMPFLPRSGSHGSGHPGSRGGRGAARRSSDEELSDDPSWGSEDVASEEEDEGGPDLAFPGGPQATSAAHRSVPAGGPARHQLQAGVHVTLVRRDANGRAIQVQEQPPANLRAQTCGRGGLGLELGHEYDGYAAGAAALAALGSAGGPGPGPSCRLQTADGASAGALGGGAASRQRTNGAAYDLGDCGRQGGVMDEVGEGERDGHGDQPMDPVHTGGTVEDSHAPGREWRQGRRRFKSDGDGGALPEGEIGEEEGEEQEEDENGAQRTRQQRAGGREQHEWARGARHPGVAPRQCRGARSGSGTSQKQRRRAAVDNGFTTVAPVLRTATAFKSSSSSSGGPTGAAGSEGQPEAAGVRATGTRQAGMVSVALAKDPLDLLAQAACEALASPRREADETPAEVKAEVAAGAAYGSAASGPDQQAGGGLVEGRIGRGGAGGVGSGAMSSQSSEGKDEVSRRGDGGDIPPQGPRVPRRLDPSYVPGVVEQRAVLKLEHEQQQQQQEALTCVGISGMGLGQGLGHCAATGNAGVTATDSRADEQQLQHQQQAASTARLPASGGKCLSGSSRQSSGGNPGVAAGPGCSREEEGLSAPAPAPILIPAPAAIAALSAPLPLNHPAVKPCPPSPPRSLAAPLLPDADSQLPANCCGPEPGDRPAVLGAAADCDQVAIASVEQLRPAAAVPAGAPSLEAITAVLRPLTDSSHTAAALAGLPNAAAMPCALPGVPPLFLDSELEGARVAATNAAAAGNVAGGLAAALLASPQHQQVPTQLLQPPAAAVAGSCPPLCVPGQLPIEAKLSAPPTDPSQVTCLYPGLQPALQPAPGLWQALAGGAGALCAPAGLGLPLPGLGPAAPAAAATPPFLAASAPSSLLNNAGYMGGPAALLPIMQLLQMQAGVPGAAPPAASVMGPGGGGADALAAAAALAAQAACALPPALMDVTGLVAGGAAPPHNMAALAMSLQQSR